MSNHSKIVNDTFIIIFNIMSTYYLRLLVGMFNIKVLNIDYTVNFVTNYVELKTMDFLLHMVTTFKLKQNAQCSLSITF